MDDIRAATAEIRLVASDEVVNRSVAVERVAFMAPNAASSYRAFREDYDIEEHKKSFHVAREKIAPAVKEYTEAARLELGTVHGRLDDLKDALDSSGRIVPN
jgi:hypothetical protein